MAGYVLEIRKGDAWERIAGIVFHNDSDVAPFKKTFFPESELRALYVDDDYVPMPASNSGVYDRSAIRQAVSLIHGGLNWSDTREGSDYWHEVYNRLEAHANGRNYTGRHTPPNDARR